MFGSFDVLRVKPDMHVGRSGNRPTAIGLIASVTAP
jgi:hypothetical protein